ncbi:protein of unknown function (plasmid) [Cupriavidus taiwanensis]|uniref:Uncharacterized protein n=1 Tax=Cupriavidus taiwanensis TaxID=164546 RepID=A0A375IQW7_9BURK|nr:protein of unknown function [Cupriavidus taiwanensis]
MTPSSSQLGRRRTVGDNPNARVQMLDTGRFALETHLREIVSSILALMESVV